MPDAEYVALVLDAKDALHDLLWASEPGTGLELHRVYNILKNQLRDFAEQAERDDIDRELRDACDRWTRLSRAERQRLALDALGDDRLTARQIYERVDRKLADTRVYRSQIDPVLKLLLDAREVERVREPRGRRVMWVYSRRRGLEGPIADLERVFRENP